jgi:hypothetical protein
MRPSALSRRLQTRARAAAAGAALALAPLAAASAADLPQGIYHPEVRYPPPAYAVCGVPVDRVILFDRYGRPTVPARTPMFYCLTGHTLTPGEVPPPPEYCCR